jgi:hypothetical protein
MVKGSTFVMEITDIDGDTTTDDLIPECNKFDQRDTVDTPNGVLYPAGVGSPEGTLIIPFGYTPAGSISW